MKNKKAVIEFTDFEKIDVRTATVLKAEEIKGSKKLIKLVLDVGDGRTRQILTGMKEWYKPEDFVGIQTLFLANLKPRKIMGEESQGMLLSVGSDDNKKPILVVTKEQADDGEVVR